MRVSGGLGLGISEIPAHNLAQIVRGATPWGAGAQEARLRHTGAIKLQGYEIGPRGVGDCNMRSRGLQHRHTSTTPGA